MDETKDFIKETKDIFKDYIDDRLLLFKMQATERISKVVAKTVSSFLIIVLAIIVILLAGISIGYYFATITNSFWKGFAISAGIYLAVILFIMIIKESWIQKPISNKIISSVFDDEANTTQV